jgi:hypothetical protein
MTVIPGTFRKTVLDIPRNDAHAAAERFAAATFAPGFRGEWEISSRADSKDFAKVNLFVYCRRS